MLEERCRVVEQAVNEDYFSLQEALKLYNVSVEDYEKYKNNINNVRF